jgi:hypothetical protein
MFLCQYKYIKGCRDGYVKDYLKKSRSFPYLPSKSPRLELNATLIILAIAIIRGLFTLDYVLTVDNKWLKTDNAVNDQAVFIAADRAGSLDANTPMRENALNLKLQVMCILAALSQCSSRYCWRRGVIIDIKHKQGPDAARDIVGYSTTLLLK